MKNKKNLMNSNDRTDVVIETHMLSLKKSLWINSSVENTFIIIRNYEGTENYKNMPV